MLSLSTSPEAATRAVVPSRLTFRNSGHSMLSLPATGPKVVLWPKNEAREQRRESPCRRISLQRRIHIGQSFHRLLAYVRKRELAVGSGLVLLGYTLWGQHKSAAAPCAVSAGKARKRKKPLS